MSRVTVVAVVCGWYLGADSPEIQNINERLAALDPCFELCDITEDGNAWGGSKFGPVMFGGAFKSFPFREFARIVLDAGWDDPQDVQVLLMDDGAPFRLLDRRDLCVIAEGGVEWMST